MLKHYVRRTHLKTFSPPPTAPVSRKLRIEEEVSFELLRLDRPLFFFFMFLTLQIFASAAALWATL